MDWTAGYASDIEYTAGFYQEQSPHFLNLICAVNGVEPVPLDRPFTYCELGFGRGLTANLLAAANPQGRFYATDFNPAHVAGARALAERAGLDNLILLEESFEALAQGRAELPLFDFITLHGIYTWVTAENRAYIVDFIGRYLKPGGVVFVSYNAMPGWAASAPLQRLLVEFGDMHPNRSDIQVKQAAGFVAELAKHALYFKDNASLDARLDTLNNEDAHYLVHEYMHKHWQPLYHADVARDLARAKLEFVSQADPVQAFPQLYLGKEVRELLATVPDPVMRETLKDYCLNSAFRKDIYVRGARRMRPQRRREWFAGVNAALLVPADEVRTQVKLGIGELNFKPEIIHPIRDALAQRPHSVEELVQLPAMRERTYEEVLQACMLLSASGQIALYCQANAAQPPAAAQAMNRGLAGDTVIGEDYCALASPLLGNGLLVPYVERLALWLLAQNPQHTDADALAREGWRILAAQQRRLTRDGRALETDEENLAELATQFRIVLQRCLPLWRQLRMV